MFAITTKVKIAAGIAAGALALGAAGAYAANANNTITTFPLSGGSLSHGGQSLNLVSTKQSATLTLPSTPFTNEGQCVSFFAQNKTVALAPTTGNTVKKNFHGKLLSSDSLKDFCGTFKTTKGAGDSAETETSDATEAATTETDSSDSAELADAPAGLGHGHGHGHGAN
ncbi:MAG TPA: hypothetical protein VM674_00745 [Candidatus Acidoferrum sp.]|nr:hypothetical protein [Candidatus Acidoferrum sp.]